jgi:hypothetical protein
MCLRVGVLEVGGESDLCQGFPPMTLTLKVPTAVFAETLENHHSVVLFPER